MHNRPSPDDIGRLLAELQQQDTPAGFDQRFWARFESSKAAGVGAAAPAYAAVAVWSAIFLVMAAALFAHLNGQWVDHPVVRILHGNTTIVSPDGHRTKAKPGTHLLPGARVVTDGDSWVVMEAPGGYRMRIHPDTEIIASKLRPAIGRSGAEFDLKRGNALVSIKTPSGSPYPFLIRTPNASARALGTRFAVSAPSTPGAASGIRVLEGKVLAGRLVQTSPSEHPTIIPAGFGAEVSDDRIEPPQRLAEQLEQELEELFQFGDKDRALLLIGMGPERYKDLLKPCLIYLRIESHTPQAYQLLTAVQKLAHAEKSGIKSERTEAVTFLEKAARLQGLRQKYPLLLFAGAYRAHLGENDAAVRVFREVGYSAEPSGWRSLGLAAAMHLSKEKLGKTEAAEDLAKIIVERFPKSEEAAFANKILGVAA